MTCVSKKTGSFYSMDLLTVVLKMFAMQLRNASSCIKDNKKTLHDGKFPLSP